MKVALVCPTVGQTQRGYERFCVDLFQLLKDDIDITLFKGAGPASAREVVVPHLTRTGIMSRVFRQRFRYPRFHLEFLSFALAMLPYLRRGRFDLIHFIDPPLARLFHHLRRFVPHRYSLLFTNAGPASYESSRWVDHIHCITPTALDETLAIGVAPERVSLLVPGLQPQAFAPAASRAELRKKFNILESTFVIVSVTTLNRHHKRVDYLIEEAAQLQGDFLLWVDGSLHPDGDPTLLTLANERLGPRFRHTHVPSGQVGELFRVADVMISSALQESFGMAIVEAMCAGLPVITHDSPHFRWLVGSDGHALDMSQKGVLASHLAEMMVGAPTARSSTGPSNAVGRFSWDHLKPKYLDMYGRAASPRMAAETGKQRATMSV